jgi:hypothetical protein
MHAEPLDFMRLYAPTSDARLQLMTRNSIGYFPVKEMVYRLPAT